ncbi:FecR family protein [Chitinophaga solisilvae]|uniref:FecR family protein n=1 Tax=Chitinophaga solisilvae TaxID=1233460 RepID=UPI00136E2C2D|nr:FecR domain-containing protein [Chitinophaga solisilvae]
MEKVIRDHLDIAGLIVRQLTGEITPVEMWKLQDWRSAGPDNEKLYQQLLGLHYLESRLQDLECGTREEALQQVMARIRREPEYRPAVRYPWRWLSYAAVVISLIAVASWMLARRGKTVPSPAPMVRSYGTPLPMANTVRLINGDNEPVALSKTGNQEISLDKDTRAGNHHGTLLYPVTGGSGSPAPMQQLITPKGMDYKVVLPDGSKVWMGADSRLSFPMAFTTAERQVTLSGEAFFDIKPDAQHPFVVTTARSVTTVLGTSFNIKSYNGERYEITTLADGAVKVSNGGRPQLLRPGQQALVAADAGIQLQTADMEEALAWKNGVFIFQHASLEEILQQLSRWYNVNIAYDSRVNTNMHFTGRMARSTQISAVLNFLETTGKVRFSLTGQQLEVLPAHRD